LDLELVEAGGDGPLPAQLGPVGGLGPVPFPP
jgi:hypothetical protein